MKLNDLDALVLYTVLEDEQKRLVSKLEELPEVDESAGFSMRQLFKKDLANTFNTLSKIKGIILNSQEISFDGSFTKLLVEEELEYLNNNFQNKEE